MKYDTKIYINKRVVSKNHKTYFIADIASNHDGDLNRAKELIYLAKQSGANCAKFQHFQAETLVSDQGFKSLKGNIGHQRKWKKSTYDIYKENETSRAWTKELAQTAKSADIDFMTTPYDYHALKIINQYVPAYKIGSGDITWIDFISEIAKKKKPVILATGASSQEDVKRAVKAILTYNKKIILLQCNTNYTGARDNFNFINLNVLTTYQKLYPNMVVGLSDHTPGHTTVLGAITLGARVIEKHFTDDNNRLGPDHSFSLTPKTWKEMIEASRDLENSLGDGIKTVQQNEKETIVVQRRSIRAKQDIRRGIIIKKQNIAFLRPAPPNSLEPYKAINILGRKLKINKVKGDIISNRDIE